MKKLKKIRNGGLLAIIVMTIVLACSESFLDQKPLGVLDEAALSNAYGANASLISAYSMLDGYNLNDVNVWAANPINWMFGSITTDDAYKGSEATDDPGGVAQTEAYQWTPSMINLNDKYVATYEGIKRCNSTILLAVSAEDLTPEERDEIIAEAKFLRAWFHLELYKVFTNVPYYKEDDIDLRKPNTDDVLAECATDLIDAIAVLPPTQSDIGRPSEFAARALLGKIYMFQAKPADGSTTLDAAKLALAKAQFDLVVPHYSLVDCYHDLWATATENNTESIFAVQSNGGASDNNQARNANWLDQLANPHGGGAYTGCCGFHQPSQNLVNAYRVDGSGLPLQDNSVNASPTSGEPVDPRLDFVAGRDGVPYLDWGIHASTWVRSPAYGGPYNNKKYKMFKTDDVPGGGWNGASNATINVQLIRLADVMLMLAECEVEIGSLDAAEDIVNEIRIRAGNCAQGPVAPGNASILDDIDDASITWANYEVAPYPDGTFATKDIARDAVRLERRLELALEGHRFFDLKRYGLTYAAEVLNDYVTVEKTRRSYLTSAETFSAKHMSFPIPTQQIQLSQVGGVPALNQNTGY